MPFGGRHGGRLRAVEGKVREEAALREIKLQHGRADHAAFDFEFQLHDPDVEDRIADLGGFERHLAVHGIEAREVDHGVRDEAAAFVEDAARPRLFLADRLTLADADGHTEDNAEVVKVEIGGAELRIDDRRARAELDGQRAINVAVADLRFRLEIQGPAVARNRDLRDRVIGRCVGGGETGKPGEVGKVVAAEAEAAGQGGEGGGVRVAFKLQGGIAAGCGETDRARPQGAEGFAQLDRLGLAAPRVAHLDVADRHFVDQPAQAGQREAALLVRCVPRDRDIAPLGVDPRNPCDERKEAKQVDPDAAFGEPDLFRRTQTLKLERVERGNARVRPVDRGAFRAPDAEGPVRHRCAKGGIGHENQEHAERDEDRGGRAEHGFKAAGQLDVWHAYQRLNTEWVHRCSPD